MSLNNVIVLLVIFNVIVDESLALKCYTCSVSENDSDTSCADDVESLGSSAITDCDKKYCTITRNDYIDPKGKLSSISRNCVDKVPTDGITEDSTFRTYQRSCKTDLCNSGSGKGDTNSGSTSLGDKSTIYAPGTNRSSASRIYERVSISLYCSIIIFNAFWNR